MIDKSQYIESKIIEPITKIDREPNIPKFIPIPYAKEWDDMYQNNDDY